MICLGTPRALKSSIFTARCLICPTFRVRVRVRIRVRVRVRVRLSSAIHGAGCVSWGAGGMARGQHTDHTWVGT